MSVVTTADIIVKNIKLGTFDFKVVNGLYDESSVQMLADYADVATGLANGLTGTSFAKSSVISSFASSAVEAYKLYQIKEPSEDPLYDTKLNSFIANAAGLLINGYELLSKVPAPQARAIGVVLGGIGAILSNYVAQGEAAVAQQEALGRL